METMCRFMMLFCMTNHEHPSSSESSDNASSSISSNPNYQGRSICSSNHSISLSSRPPATITTTTNPDPIMEENPNQKECNTPRLMQSTSVTSITYEYDNLKQVPTISYNELVLPGSETQKQMATSMKTYILGMSIDDDASIVNVDECVICMEEFTDDNPRYV